jgi:serine O-acetyltransferase
MGVVIGETAVIGDDVTLYQGVTLGGTSWNKGKRHPTLGNGVVVGAGAKVLGPFTVGDYAKIGSNAVVTKEVPAQATVVGIPGRIIVKQDVSEEKRRLMEEKIGFDAYGLSDDMPDPIARSIRSMLDHMHAVDQRLDNMCKSMQKLDGSYRYTQVPPLDDADFDAVKDRCSKSVD